MSNAPLSKIIMLPCRLLSRRGFLKHYLVSSFFKDFLQRRFCTDQDKANTWVYIKKCVDGNSLIHYLGVSALSFNSHPMFQVQVNFSPSKQISL